MLNIFEIGSLLIIVILKKELSFFKRWYLFLLSKNVPKFCWWFGKRYCKVASSRSVYYSILEFFGQRSQYIRIKFPLHKPSENLQATARDFTVWKLNSFNAQSEIQILKRLAKRPMMQLGALLTDSVHWYNNLLA